MNYEIILAYIAIIGLIFGFTNHFEVKNNPIRIKLANLLKEKKKSDVIESSKIFIEIFDNIYYKSTSNKYNEYIWTWIIMVFAVTLFLGPLNFMFELSNYYLSTSFSRFSPFSIPLPVAIVSGIILGTILYVIYLEEKDNFKSINNSSIFQIIISNYVSALISAGGFFLLVLIVRIINPWYISHLNGPNFPIFNVDIIKYFILYIISSLFLFVIMFYFRLFLSLINYIISKNRKLFKTSPFRSIVSSLIFIVFFSLVFNNSAYSFYSDFHQFGWILLSYLFLNIFADCFSLLETRYVLEKASLGTKNSLIILVIFDIFANSLIFLLIPIMTGNLNTFSDAIFLKGDKPWLAIFFWSSFGTSFAFYLYILSYLFIVYSKIEILPVIEKPFWSIGVVGMAIVTFIFSIYYFFNIVIALILLYIGTSWFLKKRKNIQSNG